MAHPLLVWNVFFVAFLVVRWSVVKCPVALVTGLGPGEVEVPVAVRCWRCSGLSDLLQTAGAVALFKVPPQTMGLVQLFLFAFVFFKGSC